MINKIRKSFDLFVKSSFVKSVFSIGTGNLIAQLMSLISVPILTRIYSNEAYGDYGIIASTITIVVSFAAMGLSSAIMEPKDENKSRKVFKTAFIIEFLVVLAISVGAILLYPRVKLFEINGSYYVAVLLFCIYAITISTTSILSTFVNRMGLNKVLLVNPIITSACNFVIAIPLGMLGVGYKGFLISYIIGNSIGNLQMIIRSKPYLGKYRKKDFFNVIKEYKEYIYYQCPANLLANLGTQFPVQYLSRQFGSVQLSHYTVSNNLLNYPIRLIAGPIGTVYFRKASENVRENKDISKFTFRLVVGAMLIAFIPMLLFSLIGEQVIGFILGENWAQTGRVMSIVIIQYVLLFCSRCTSYCKVSLGKQRMNFIFGIVGIVVTVLFSVLGYKMSDGNIMMTIVACTAARCTINIFDVALNFYCLKKYLLKYLLFAIPYTILFLGIIVFKLFG